MTTEYLGDCQAPGLEPCPNPATRDTEDHGPLCDAHRKRLLPSREGGVALSEPIRERPADTGEWLRKAAIEYAEADSDVEYAEAEKDLDAVAVAKAELKRAKRNLDRAADARGSDLARRRLNESIKEGMARAAAAGVNIGRTPKVDQRGAAEAVREHGNARKAAAALGISLTALYRALRGALKNKPKGSDLSPHGQMHALADRPPSTPSSEEP